tara:strand:- start:2867 stop:3868 length:1002 start_codon:yes stop_codon:yes gene_type:complete
MQSTYSNTIKKWLWINIVMLIFMIILGGVTRLEDAGLSIVEWAPLTGILPPFNQSDWLQLFAQYKTSPEFQKVNFMMTLGEFKYIFWLEYLHRLWGRLFGLVFFLPALYFWIRKGFNVRQKKQILSLVLLGVAQAVMGWYMVKSGLVDDPHVSHFRLATHFCLALAILGVLLWMAFDLGHKRSLYLSIWIIGPITDMLLLTIIYGAFVAGLDAGLVYNDTFPHMGTSLIPSDAWGQGGIWYNALNNPVMIQFIHRWLAMMTAVLVIFLAWKIKAQNCKVAWFLTTGILIQVALGITTLFTNVNTWVAEAHQLGAVFLFSLFVYMWWSFLRAAR